MKIALSDAIAAAKAMKPRAFNNAKSMADPRLLYVLHGDGHGELIALDRQYRPLGYTEGGNVEYGEPRFAHLRMAEIPAVRSLAIEVNENGCSAFPGGVRVPIFVFLGAKDTRETYCARLSALVQALREAE